ncbi:MAG: hypothetical protein JWM76_2310 [Pseudonocardiales bacterium]|nr:hypothetical protein [Pseudonocardiales bacterium]
MPLRSAESQHGRYWYLPAATGPFCAIQAEMINKDLDPIRTISPVPIWSSRTAPRGEPLTGRLIVTQRDLDFFNRATARTAILNRITLMANQASASELRQLAEAYTAVCEPEKKRKKE